MYLILQKGVRKFEGNHLQSFRLCPESQCVREPVGCHRWKGRQSYLCLRDGRKGEVVETIQVRRPRGKRRNKSRRRRSGHYFLYHPFQGWVIQLLFLDHGAKLASGSEDASIRLWDLKRGTLLRVLPQDEAITTLTISPSKTFADLIIFGDKMGKLSYLNIDERETVHLLPNILIGKSITWPEKNAMKIYHWVLKIHVSRNRSPLSILQVSWQGCRCFRGHQQRISDHSLDWQQVHQNMEGQK